MAALIRVVDVRRADFKRSLQIVQAEFYFQSFRQLPVDDITTEPVDDGNQVSEAFKQFT